LRRIARDDLLRGIVVPLAEERDVDTLRQISLLLERENQRLIAKNLQLTAELARLRGLSEVEQLTFAVERTLQQTRATILDGVASTAAPPPSRLPRPGHGPACGGTLTELVGQCETAERITTVKATYHIEYHARQKYRCACNGAVVTAPAPPALIPGGRYTPAFAVGVAVAKYADHLPLERQVRMMAREGLIVESQTLWDQIQALARWLEPTYEALGQQALAAPVIHVDETRWPRLGSGALSAGTVWGVATPTTAFYRILPGKSADEGRQILGGYRGTVVVDGYAVYEVLARDGPDFALAHCWAHTKRKFQANATDWPTACGEIDELIGDLYAVERLVPGRFPGDAAAQALRHQLRQERSRLITDRIKAWATEQVGLPRSELGKAVRYMLERWTGLTRFLDNPCIPLDNNAAERALRGPVVGRKNHYGSKSLRGTQVAALFYTLCESAKLLGVDPHTYLLTATEAALAAPGTVTLPAAVTA